MKIHARFVTAALGLFLFAGCAQQQDSAPMPMLDKCVISMEPVDDNSPSTQFEGQTVRFCCKSCLAEWNDMDAEGKRATLAKAMK